jgi:hypothetical protein
VDFQTPEQRFKDKPLSVTDGDSHAVNFRKAMQRQRRTKYLPRPRLNGSGADSETTLSAEARECGLAIAACWNKLVAGIVETGRMLIGAKEQFTGEFHALIERCCPFGVRTAQRLMAIASDPVLSDATHGSRLPPSWRTLWVLTQIPDEQKLAMLKMGLIHPEMERRDAEALLERARCHEVFFYQNLQDALDALTAIKSYCPDAPALAQKLGDNAPGLSSDHAERLVGAGRGGEPFRWEQCQALSKWLAQLHGAAERIVKTEAEEKRNERIQKQVEAEEKRSEQARKQARRGAAINPRFHRASSPPAAAPPRRPISSRRGAA